MGKTKNIHLQESERSYLRSDGLSEQYPYYLPIQEIDNRHGLYIDSLDDIIYHLEYAIGRFALLDEPMQKDIRNAYKRKGVKLSLSDIKHELIKMKLCQ